MDRPSDWQNSIFLQIVSIENVGAIIDRPLVSSNKNDKVSVKSDF